MKLIVPSVTIPHQISWCSHDLGIPPLIIVMYAVAISMVMILIRVRRELNKHFYPIKQRGNAKCNQYATFDWIRVDKSVGSQCKAAQSQKMTPNKFGYPLCFSPNKLYILHRLIFDADIHFHDQDSINFTNKYPKNFEDQRSSLLVQEGVGSSCKSVNNLRSKLP